jgi:hypothetical protein
MMHRNFRSGIQSCLSVHPPISLSNWYIPWSRVLPEKLTGPKLVINLFALYETWRLITAFTSICHLPFWHQVNPVQDSPSHFLKINFNIILPSTSRTYKWSHSLISPHQNLVYSPEIKINFSLDNEKECLCFASTIKLSWWASINKVYSQNLASVDLVMLLDSIILIRVYTIHVIIGTYVSL